MRRPKRRGRDYVGYAFIAPNLLIFLVFVALPFLFALGISFTNWDYTQGFGSIRLSGIHNFIEQWTDTWFTTSLKNTFWYVLGTVPATILIALVIAYLVENLSFAKNLIKLALFIPYVSNIVAVSVVWMMMYAKTGMISQFVRFLGFTPPIWLADYTWAMPAVILMSIWLGIGYAVMIYSAGLSAIPQELYEAARIDGASQWRQFTRITVPLLSNTTFFLTVTSVVAGFRVFGQIYVLTQGGPGAATQVLVYYIFTAGFRFFRMGYAASISVFLFVILLVITLIQWKANRPWEA